MFLLHTWRCETAADLRCRLCGAPDLWQRCCDKAPVQLINRQGRLRTSRYDRRGRSYHPEYRVREDAGLASGPGSCRPGCLIIGKQLNKLSAVHWVLPLCVFTPQCGWAAGRKKKSRHGQAWQLPPRVLETLEAFLMEPAQLVAEHAALDAHEAAAAGDPNPRQSPVATLSDTAEAASAASARAAGNSNPALSSPSDKGLAQGGAAVQDAGVLDARGTADRARSQTAGAPAAGLPSDQLSEGVPLNLGKVS